MRETTLIKIYERRTKELLTQLPFISEDDGKALVEVVKNPESAMFDRRKVVEYLVKEWGIDVGVDCNNYCPMTEDDVRFFIGALKNKYYDENVFC
jgi:hypothetical protein